MNSLSDLHTSTLKAALIQHPKLKPLQPHSAAVTQETGLTHIHGALLGAAALMLTGKIEAVGSRSGDHLCAVVGGRMLHLQQDAAMNRVFTAEPGMSQTDQLIGAAATLLLVDLTTPGEHPLRTLLSSAFQPAGTPADLPPAPLERLSAHLAQLLRQAEQDPQVNTRSGILTAPREKLTAVFAGAAVALTPGAAAAAQPALEGRLSRWIQQGLNVLLVGPTATFKTTTATRAAAGAGAYIVMVGGRPGLEDRDLFGGIYPSEKGPAWVDGPVTEAFAKAAEGVRTVLILNELTRFEPMYLGAMIGALDDVDVATLRQMGASPTKEAPARYYALRLPNGELISAPVDTLSVIGTTNIGQDYQAAQELDAALLRRFDRHVDVPYADELRTAAVINSKCPHPGLATAAAHLELRSRTEVQGAGPGHEGLLARELNPAVSAALAMEALDLHTRQGLSLVDAFIEAAEVTAVPFCVPRTLSGALDGSALAHFQDLIREVAEGLAVLTTPLPAQPRRAVGPAFAPLQAAGA